MNRARHALIWMTGAMLLAVPLRAQTVAPPAVPMPVAPLLKSPVERFRELLAMSKMERRRALTNRPIELQVRTLAKLREYDALPEPQRQLRLQATELRWYLRPLMELPRTNRAAALARIPEEKRKLVQERLARWDLLPPQLQQDLLNQDLAAHYFSAMTGATPAQRQGLLQQVSPERRAQLEKVIDRWSALSDEEQRRTLAGFNRWFELTAGEKQRTLNALSDAERRQMETTLSAYGQLTPEQRAQCVRSFEKFANLNAEERQEFLRNAARWKEMSPADRQAWRNLVKVAPIMPPEIPTHQKGAHGPGPAVAAQ